VKKLDFDEAAEGRQAGIFYQAQSWPHPRRVAAKCEYAALGANSPSVNRLG